MSETATILAVDDSSESLALLVQVLTAQGYQVRAADSGELALASLETIQPDLVLTDIRMTGMDGLELCRRLKARDGTRHVPVILMSAFAEVKQWVEGLQAGAADFLPKPFRVDELLTRVRTHISLHRTAEALEHTTAELRQANEQLRTEIAERRHAEMDLRRSLEQAAQSQRALVEALEQQKRAEDALRARSEEYEALIEGLPDIVTRCDRDGRILFISANVQETEDMQAEQFIGKTSRELGFPEEHCRFIEDAIQTVFDTDAPLTVEFTFMSKKGPVVISSRLVPERDARGAVQSVLSVAQDVTAQRQTEDALRQSEYFFRESQRAASIGSYETDFTAGVWESSEVLDQIFGIGPDYSRSVQGWLEIVHPDDREMLDRYLRDEVIAKRQPFAKEYRIIRKTDAELRWVSGFGKVCFDPDGRILSMIGTIQDITERKRAEDQKAQLEVQLLQSQKMEVVGQLAGGIAHDFNNILGAVIMQLNMLRLQPCVPPDELGQAVDEMLESTNRAANLTRQLLLFSRRQALKTGRHDANVLIRELAKLIERLIDERATLVLQLSEEPLWFEGDAGMIEQVVTNLCVNARDAMPKGGRLTIATAPVVLGDETATHHRTPGRHLCLQVSDTGHGIESSVLEHVFEPFFTTKEPGKGTGLGLASVYAIVARHGGFVEVASQVDRGSRFSVYLPSVSAAGASEPRRAPSGVRGGSESILVVEDEAAVRRMAVRCLRQLGYLVAEALNGADAVEVWERDNGEFDLLFTDMVMPGGLSGLELFEILRESKAGLRAIVASGYSAEIVDSENATALALTYLPKPYDVATLAATVRECLEKQGQF